MNLSQSPKQIQAILVPKAIEELLNAGEMSLHRRIKHRR
jgi:hypothetical protein